MEGRRESFGEAPQPGQTAAQRWKSSRDDGIIARSVNQIFETLEKAGNEFSVRVSHLELYNEELRDLLNPANKGLKLIEDANNGGKVVVHNLEEKNVYTPQDIFDVLQKSWEEVRKFSDNFCSVLSLIFTFHILFPIRFLASLVCLVWAFFFFFFFLALLLT